LAGRRLGLGEVFGQEPHARAGDRERSADFDAPEPGAGGVLLLISRVSVEMVREVASFGAGLVVAVSAPTALAVRAADRAGITLIAVARRDGFEAFTHSQRILPSAG
jgi:FdhD protein